MISLKRLPTLMHSLKARLIVSAMLLILVLIPIVGITLNDAFKLQVKSASVKELKAYVYSILAVTEVDNQQLFMPEALLENQFNVIQSGLYALITVPERQHQALTSSTSESTNEAKQHSSFDAKFVEAETTKAATAPLIAEQQVTAGTKVAWRSNSLLGIDLSSAVTTAVHTAPAFPQPEKGQGQFSEIILNGEPHLVYGFSASFETQQVDEQGDEQITRFPITVYIIKDQSDYQLQVNEFNQQLWRWLLILMVALLSIQLLWLWWTLKPLTRLQRELAAIENGKTDHLAENYPAELSSVAKQLNTLLNTEQNQRKRYRNALSDLAHSLKTPLAVIQSQKDLSKQSFEQISHINRIIGHQLKRAQSAAGSAWHLGVEVVEVSDKLVRNLPKIYCQPAITITEDVDRSTVFKGDAADLSEILGNLMDNACKAAASRVLLTVKSIDSSLVIAIEDDGKGIDEALHSQIFERGIRADSYQQGHGIGLAIVRDLVDSYQGQLLVSRSKILGGAKFELRFKT
ncbi:ATP-binding protein [Shewanella sp. MBTL60-007]|uniref:ATP-binding protein n=1 Tax=Shewanella sp. MBTL60-007 TaxID=2815911 RepID=UPI001BC267EE|nr:ATP-binding protein [Shewanella sp. MBTL60-007]GIU31026.1 two-component sensor histidine kinase [Shewanella sp. MBTL60-007]